MGVLSFANGDKYEGPFVEGIRTGNGTLTKPNGTKYEGEFENNEKTKG